MSYVKTVLKLKKKNYNANILMEPIYSWGNKIFIVSLSKQTNIEFTKRQSKLCSQEFYKSNNLKIFIMNKKIIYINVKHLIVHFHL